MEDGRRVIPLRFDIPPCRSDIPPGRFDPMAGTRRLVVVPAGDRVLFLPIKLRPVMFRPVEFRLAGFRPIAFRPDKFRLVEFRPDKFRLVGARYLDDVGLRAVVDRLVAVDLLTPGVLLDVLDGLRVKPGDLRGVLEGLRAVAADLPRVLDGLRVTLDGLRVALEDLRVALEDRREVERCLLPETERCLWLEDDALARRFLPALASSGMEKVMSNTLDVTKNRYILDLREGDDGGCIDRAPDALKVYGCIMT